MSLNNWKMIAQTRSHIFRWRSRFRRRRICLSSILPTKQFSLPVLNTKDSSGSGHNRGVGARILSPEILWFALFSPEKRIAISVQNIRAVNISVTDTNFKFSCPLIVNFVEDAPDDEDQAVIVVRQPLIWLRLINFQGKVIVLKRWSKQPERRSRWWTGRWINSDLIGFTYKMITIDPT